MDNRQDGGGEVEVREFSSFLIDMPQAHDELGSKLQELIAAVRETGKAGAISLKIGVKMLPGAENAMVMTPTVTLSKPKFELKAGVFYADKQNNPRRNDPNQPGLFDETDIKDAPADIHTGEIKELDK